MKLVSTFLAMFVVVTAARAQSANGVASQQELTEAMKELRSRGRNTWIQEQLDSERDALAKMVNGESVTRTAVLAAIRGAAQTSVRGRGDNGVRLQLEK